MHLNQKGINVFATSPGPKGEAHTLFSLGRHKLYSDGGCEYIPVLGDGLPLGKIIQLNEWWNEVVYIIEGLHISRKTLY